jgi:protein-S-isoprenylcysteine O-methyltransferase Ste14
MPSGWLGMFIFAAGGTLRLWPAFVLGHRFSGLVAIQSGHTLVTTGIHRPICHPSYLGLLLTALGWAFGFRSGVGILLVAFLMLQRPISHQPAALVPTG